MAGAGRFAFGGNHVQTGRSKGRVSKRCAALPDHPASAGSKSSSVALKPATISIPSAPMPASARWPPAWTNAVSASMCVPRSRAQQLRPASRVLVRICAHACTRLVPRKPAVQEPAARRRPAGRSSGAAPRSVSSVRTTREPELWSSTVLCDGPGVRRVPRAFRHASVVSATWHPTAADRRSA